MKADVSEAVLSELNIVQTNFLPFDFCSSAIRVKASIETSGELTTELAVVVA